MKNFYVFWLGFKHFKTHNMIFQKTRVFLVPWRKIIKYPQIRQGWKLRHHVKYVVLLLCDYLIINEKDKKNHQILVLWSYIVFLAPWRKILVHPLFILFYLESNHIQCLFLWIRITIICSIKINFNYYSQFKSLALVGFLVYKIFIFFKMLHLTNNNYGMIFF